jgi:hypothetical protein
MPPAIGLATAASLPPIPRRWNGWCESLVHMPEGCRQRTIAPAENCHFGTRASQAADPAQSHQALALADLHAFVDLVAGMEHHKIAFVEAFEDFCLQAVLPAGFHDLLTNDSLDDLKHGWPFLHAK